MKASPISIARSGKILQRNPPPVSIQAILLPRPGPSLMTEVSIPPICARFEILSSHPSLPLISIKFISFYHYSLKYLLSGSHTTYTRRSRVSRSIPIQNNESGINETIPEETIIPGGSSKDEIKPPTLSDPSTGCASSGLPSAAPYVSVFRGSRPFSGFQHHCPLLHSSEHYSHNAEYD